jgi:hypothetical protein
MLTESTKINKKGITTMQLSITLGPKDLASAVWVMVKGSFLWCKQDRRGHLLQEHGPARLKETR